MTWPWAFGTFECCVLGRCSTLRHARTLGIMHNCSSLCVSAALQKVNFSRINIPPNALYRCLSCLPLLSPGVFSTRGLHCSPVQPEPSKANPRATATATATRASTSQKRLERFNHRHLALPCLPPPPRDNHSQTSTPLESLCAHTRLPLSLLPLASLAPTSPRPDRYSYSLLNCQSIRLSNSRAAASSDRPLPDLDVCAKLIASR